MDLKKGRVRVTRTRQRSPDRTLPFFEPNTTRARREIVLPTFLVPVLLEHGKAQAERKLLAGPDWHDFDLLCERGDGRPMDPDSFGHAFERLAAEAGISPHTRLHDIRHGVATVLREQQVPPSGRVGNPRPCVRELHDGDLPARHAEDDRGRGARPGIGAHSPRRSRTS